MTSDRPYRKGMAADAAFAELEKQKGKQFDPDIAAAFLEIRPCIVQQMTQEDQGTVGVKMQGHAAWRWLDVVSA